MAYNTGRTFAPYLYTGDYAKENNATAYKPGELGGYYDFGQDRAACVVVDSGATAATAAGAVAAGQAAYWKDKTKSLVTNDSRFAEQPTNPQLLGAGVFMTAVTAGYQCWILTRGTKKTVLTTGTGNAGDNLSVNAVSGSPSPLFVATAAGSAPSNAAPVIGVLRTAISAGSCTADIFFPEVP